MTKLDDLPVELIADILGELDLLSLIKVSQVSPRLLDIVSDPSLNPWRRPILRNLRSGSYESCLANLSVRSSVPRHNWIEILSLANPHFILYQATLPNLPAADWEEAFKRRFLPGWQKWKRDATWKAAFLKMLGRVYHRSTTTCTSEESWTKYIVLNRNGSANELEVSSRAFSPLAIFNEMKLQSNLSHLETRIRLIVQLADVRIIALGVLHKPRSTLTINTNAHVFLHPPGIIPDGNLTQPSHNASANVINDHGVYPLSNGPGSMVVAMPSNTYTLLTHPLPSLSHINYPWYTPGGGDKRWVPQDSIELETETSSGSGLGYHWVGGLMIIAQLITPKIHEHSPSGDWLPLQDLDLVVGPGRQQYASFTWNDLWAVAPWMEERVTKRIDGPGLGI